MSLFRPTKTKRKGFDSKLIPYIPYVASWPYRTDIFSISRWQGRPITDSWEQEVQKWQEKHLKIPQDMSDLLGVVSKMVDKLEEKISKSRRMAGHFGFSTKSSCLPLSELNGKYLQQFLLTHLLDILLWSAFDDEDPTERRLVLNAHHPQLGLTEVWRPLKTQNAARFAIFTDDKILKLANDFVELSQSTLPSYQPVGQMPSASIALVQPTDGEGSGGKETEEIPLLANHPSNWPDSHVFLEHATTNVYAMNSKALSMASLVSCNTWMLISSLLYLIKINDGKYVKRFAAAYKFINVDLRARATIEAYLLEEEENEDEGEGEGDQGEEEEEQVQKKKEAGGNGRKGKAKGKCKYRSSAKAHERSRRLTLAACALLYSPMFVLNPEVDLSKQKAIDYHALSVKRMLPLVTTRENDTTIQPLNITLTKQLGETLKLASSLRQIVWKEWPCAGDELTCRDNATRREEEEESEDEQQEQQGSLPRHSTRRKQAQTTLPPEQPVNKKSKMSGLMTTREKMPTREAKREHSEEDNEDIQHVRKRIRVERKSSSVNLIPFTGLAEGIEPNFLNKPQAKTEGKDKSATNKEVMKPKSVEEYFEKPFTFKQYHEIKALIGGIDLKQDQPAELQPLGAGSKRCHGATVKVEHVVTVWIPQVDQTGGDEPLGRVIFKREELKVPFTNNSYPFKELLKWLDLCQFNNRSPPEPVAFCQTVSKTKFQSFSPREQRALWQKGNIHIFEDSPNAYSGEERSVKILKNLGVNMTERRAIYGNGLENQGAKSMEQPMSGMRHDSLKQFFKQSVVDRLDCNFLNIPLPSALGYCQPECLRNLSLNNELCGVTAPFDIPYELLQWCLFATPPARTDIHIDAGKFHTWINPQSGIQLWMVQKPSPEVEEVNVSDVNETHGKWHGMILRPGDVLIMQANTNFRVVTLAESVTMGGHFYSIDDLERTMMGGLREHFWGNTSTNTNYAKSEALTYRLGLYLFRELQERSELAIESEEESQPISVPIELEPKVYPPLIFMLLHPERFEPSSGDNNDNKLQSALHTVQQLRTLSRRLAFNLLKHKSNLLDDVDKLQERWNLLVRNAVG